MFHFQKYSPKLYENIYTTEVGNYLLFFNSAFGKLAILGKEAQLFYQLINGQRKIQDIFELVKAEGQNMNFPEVIQIFEKLLKSGIIYFGKKNKIKPLSPSFIPKNLNVRILITSQCNLRCAYCYLYKKIPQELREMSDEILQKTIAQVIKNAKEHGFEKITIKFSGGEPLLQFKKILNCLRKTRKLVKGKNLEINFGILTNGTLVTEKIAKVLKEKNILTTVSLDGLPEYHDAQRVFPDGSGSFKYVERGLKNLQEIQAPFDISVTITSKNMENLPDFTKYLLDYRSPFTFSFYRKTPFANQELEINSKKLIYYLEQAYQIIYNNPPSYKLIDRLLDRVNPERPRLYSCGVGRNFLIVRPDGKIVSCPMTFETPIGSVEDKDLTKVIKRGDFTKGVSVEERNLCRRCQWKYICGGGCPFLALKQKGDYKDSSPYCEVYKALIPEILKIEAKRLICY